MANQQSALPLVGSKFCLFICSFHFSGFCGVHPSSKQTPPLFQDDKYLICFSITRKIFVATVFHRLLRRPVVVLSRPRPSVLVESKRRGDTVPLTHWRCVLVCCGRTVKAQMSTQPLKIESFLTCIWSKTSNFLNLSMKLFYDM